MIDTRSYNRAVAKAAELLKALGVTEDQAHVSINRIGGSRPGYRVVVTRLADGVTTTGRTRDTAVVVGG